MNIDKDVLAILESKKSEAKVPEHIGEAQIEYSYTESGEVWLDINKGTDTKYNIVGSIEGIAINVNADDFDEARFKIEQRLEENEIHLFDTDFVVFSGNESRNITEDFEGNMVDHAKALAKELIDLENKKVNDYVFAMNINKLYPLAKKLQSDFEYFLQSTTFTDILNRYADSLARSIKFRLEQSGYTVSDLKTLPKNNRVFLDVSGSKLSPDSSYSVAICAENAGHRIKNIENGYVARATIVRDDETLNMVEIPLSEDATIPTQLADKVVQAFETIV